MSFSEIGCSLQCSTEAHGIQHFSAIYINVWCLFSEKEKDTSATAPEEEEQNFAGKGGHESN